MGDRKGQPPPTRRGLRRGCCCGVALVGGVTGDSTTGPVCVDADGATRTGTVSVVEPTVSVMRSAGRLVVDPRLHAGEIARFTSHVVCGPTAADCNIWTWAIGADGYGRYYLTRQGMGCACAPPLRAGDGRRSIWRAGVFGLHECDNPFLGGFQRVAAASRGSPRRR